MGTQSLGKALDEVHRRMEEELGRLGEPAASSEDRGQALASLASTLRSHIYFEEAHLFPGLRRGAMLPAVVVMEREHGAMWATLGALETSGVPDAALCAALGEQLATHHPKEESTIYDHVDEVLGEDACRALVALVDAVEAPAGWSCRFAPE